MTLAPHHLGGLRRAQRISLKGFTLGGDEVSAETSGFDAGAIHHEVDHLEAS